MAGTLAAQICRIAEEQHVKPALASRRREFSISVRDLMDEARRQGISTLQRTPAFCSSIRTDQFLRKHGLSISKVDGPPSGMGTRVVVHYKLSGDTGNAASAKSGDTFEEQIDRLLKPIRGAMREAVAAHGGVEGYMRWVRSADEEASR